MQITQRNRNALHSFVDQVFSFLPSNKQYEGYKTIFIDEEISLDIACDLDDEALEEIGVVKKIHRSKILKTIQKITALNPRATASRPPSAPVRRQPPKRSRTPPGLYDSPPEKPTTTLTPSKPIKATLTQSIKPQTSLPPGKDKPANGKTAVPGEPDYVPGQSKLFFINMQLLKPNNINWEVTLERHFAQFGQNVKITYLHNKKLAFVELVLDPDHLTKFPNDKRPFVHHQIQGHRLTLKVATHRPYGPRTKELIVKVGSRVAGLWNGKYLPATVCEVRGDFVYVLFDGYEGFKEAIERKSIKHLNQVDGDSETTKIHDWTCSKCQNNCFGSKPTCNMCGEVSPSIKKMRALKPGVKVTCSFGNERQYAVVDSIQGKLVLVRRAGAQIVEPTTVWDIKIVGGGDEGSSIFSSGTPGSVAAPAKKMSDRVVVENRIRAWIRSNPRMCLAKLCSSVDIPYRSYGFQNATAFLHSIHDVKISPHPKNIVSLVGKEQDANDLRKRVEQKILRWVRENPDGHVNILCSRVKIPYERWGFQKPLNFLKSVDGIKIVAHPSHIGVHIVHLTGQSPQKPHAAVQTKDDLRKQVIEFVKSLLENRNNKFTEYVPYNILIKGYDSHAKKFGYGRLLDFIQKVIPELEIQKNPDARVYLKQHAPKKTPLAMTKIIKPIKMFPSKPALLHGQTPPLPKPIGYKPKVTDI